MSEKMTDSERVNGTPVGQRRSYHDFWYYTVVRLNARRALLHFRSPQHNLYLMEMGSSDQWQRVSRCLDLDMPEGETEDEVMCDVKKQILGASVQLHESHSTSKYDMMCQWVRMDEIRKLWMHVAGY